MLKRKYREPNGPDNVEAVHIEPKSEPRRGMRNSYSGIDQFPLSSYGSPPGTAADGGSRAAYDSTESVISMPRALNS